MFYIIGLGLGDSKDITVKGLEIVKRCERVYLEAYTSILTCGAEALVNILFWYHNKIFKCTVILGGILWTQINYR